MGGGEGKKGKRIAKATEDGTGFDATEEAAVEGSEGLDTVKAKRKWRLSSDGKILTIEIELEGGQGNMKSKRVFVKQ